MGLLNGLVVDGLGANFPVKNVPVFLRFFVFLRFASLPRPSYAPKQETVPKNKPQR